MRTEKTMNEHPFETPTKNGNYRQPIVSKLLSLGPSLVTLVDACPDPTEHYSGLLIPNTNV